MKVTKREQILLGVLLIMLLGYSYYNFVYTKQNEKIIELKASKDTNSQKWEQVKVKIASKDKKIEQYTTLNAKIFNETDKLLPSIEQEEIIVVLDKMIKDSNIKADVLGFTQVSSENTPVDTSKAVADVDESKIVTNELDKLVSAFNGTSEKDASSEKTNTDNSNTAGAYKMEVTLDFNGMYDEFISFIEQVEDYDKKIIINSINLLGAEGSDISGTIILEFYGIPKLNDNYEFEWDYKKPSGNVSPFVGSSTSLQVNNEVIPNNTESNVVNNDNGIIPNNEENTVATDEIKSDFVMSAKPITSDLHTVTIGKAKDDSKQSYIYSNNEGIEQVEFLFSKTDDKYFYKYKTSLGSYPKEFSKAIEFVPNGENIILDIESQKRDLGTDLSGANIKITNDTDKSVAVNILDDDKTKPRVTIVKEKGDISVVRNYIYYSGK